MWNGTSGRLTNLLERLILGWATQSWSNIDILIKCTVLGGFCEQLSYKTRGWDWRTQLLKFMYLLPKTSIPGSNCRCLVSILFLNGVLRDEFTMTLLQRSDWCYLDHAWLWCSVSLVLRRHGTWGHRSVAMVLEYYIDWRKWTILAKLPVWSWKSADLLQKRAQVYSNTHAFWTTNDPDVRSATRLNNRNNF